MAQSPRGPWACRWQPQITLLFPVLLQTGGTHLPVHPGEPQGPITNKVEACWRSGENRKDMHKPLSPTCRWFWEISLSIWRAPHLAFLKKRYLGRESVSYRHLKRKVTSAALWALLPWLPVRKSKPRSHDTEGSSCSGQKASGPGCRAPRKQRGTDGFHSHPFGYNLQSRAFLFLTQWPKDGKSHPALLGNRVRQLMCPWDIQWWHC